jgi:23S rRNA (uridine2552-2'-O)-methyltransferase
MARSKSSNRWLQEHHSDQYVKLAREAGYRSRASFKLLELDRIDHFLKPGAVVIDLGAAPGGWSQIAAQRVGDSGRVIACDILPMDGLPGVAFIAGDFTEEQTLRRVLEELGNVSADVVISDMAPNMSGNKAVDIPTSMHLVELAFDLACKVLKINGVFVTKVFHGEGFDTVLKQVRTVFGSVHIRKPEASRSRSRETYLVAKGFHV